ncbi:radical SAM protein [candidate division KSB1 bacterium]|nr:radical SAM protein [candidate division KSB1 bacterium]
MSKTILCVNPWIYDFAAFDFWMKPIGLLRIAGILRDMGYDIVLLDCLDRFHPSLKNSCHGPLPGIKSDTTGKFLREKLAKPKVLSHVPRFYCRYGMPPDLVGSLLSSCKKPDYIFLTSLMTYWYPAVRDMADILRHFFPGIPIVLGGVYAALCTEHAHRVVQPDFLYAGNNFKSLVDFLAGLFNQKIDCSSDFPRPAFDLYPDLKSVAIETSRGCPNKCGFCASRILCRNFVIRSADDVFDEIIYWHREYSVRHFCFYDDALLYQSNACLIPLLQRIIDADLDLCFHAPNGIQPKYIDEQLAGILYRAGFKTIRLSFESSSERRQKAMGLKVTNKELSHTVDILHRAGFRSRDIGVYVLMGLADQDIDEVQNSVDFVQNLGAFVSLSSFSPIPGTAEWTRAVKAGLWNEDTDLLLSNNSVFPLWSQKYGYHECVDLMSRIIHRQQQG